MLKIGLIGGGNMGEALLRGLTHDNTVSVTEKNQRRASFLRRRYGVATLPLPALVQRSRILILAVKPQDLDGVLDQLAGDDRPHWLVISIAAGITTAYIEKKIGGRVRVVRAMPNLPLQIAQGITAVCRGRYASRSDLNTVCRIFNQLGQAVAVQEKDMDAVTAVSGSGPAYVFLVAEMIINAARSLGLDASLSHQLVQKTLTGSIALLERSKEDPAQLRARVTSKGGTTQAAMDVFMRQKLDKIFKAALAAAKKRSRQLAKK